MADPTSPRAWGNQLAKLWGNRFPVRVQQIALEYSAQRFPGDVIHRIKGHAVDGVEGMLVRSDTKPRWYILYDERVEIVGRRNFTVAHELGHYLLHRQSVSEFRCNQHNVLGRKDGVDRNSVQEGEANVFASYLLMPINDFREQIGTNSVSIDALRHCADRYEVSLTAATLKWLEFTEQSAMLIASRDGIVLWSWCSGSARASHRGRGTELPQQSLWFSRVPHPEREGCMMPRGIWHPTDDTREFLIRSDRYDFSISLVLFPRQYGFGQTWKEREPEDLAARIERHVSGRG